ncbi:MAG: cupin domain-containing protein [Anaerotruncus sp.]|nr:cupin domain-containing protein [Anaerotruncus sp.]
MFYKYDFANTIPVPEPFKRYMTPIFMGDDKIITESNFSIHMTEWEPGCEIDEHSHPTDMEAMYCISGHGECWINGEHHDFVPDTLMVAPPTIPHRIRNNGTEMLRVLCVFSRPITGEGLRKRAMEAVEANQKAAKADA